MKIFQMGFTHRNLCNPLALKLFARENVAFYTNQDFLFHNDRYHIDGPSSSESKEPRFRLLEIEANAVLYIARNLGHLSLPSTADIFRKQHGGNDS